RQAPAARRRRLRAAAATAARLRRADGQRAGHRRRVDVAVVEVRPLVERQGQRVGGRAGVDVGRADALAGRVAALEEVDIVRDAGVLVFELDRHLAGARLERGLLELHVLPDDGERAARAARRRRRRRLAAERL